MLSSCLLPLGVVAQQQLLCATPQLVRTCQLRFRSSAAEPARAEEPPIASKQAAPGAAPGAAKAKAPGAATAPLNFDDPKAAFQAKSTGSLIRSLLVFKLCQIGPLVRNADTLLRLSKRILGTTVTNALLEPTFYKQFVAGSDAQSIQPTLAYLRRSGIRAILDYAAEDDVDEPKSREEPNKSAVVRTYAYEGEELCDRRMSVFRKSIEAAGLAEGQGFAAIKVTALGLPRLLERVSTALLAIRGLFQQFDTDGNGFITQEEFAKVYTELFVDASSERIEQIFKHLDTDHTGKVDYLSWSKKITAFDTQDIARRCRSEGPFARAALNDEEQQLLRNMMRRVEALAQLAAESDVRLMIDAEHTYFQPAIDNTVTLLQQTYNRKEPVIFNTYQAYLKDAHDRLSLDMERARREGYKFGAKLVRGAYMVLERARAEERGYPSPIQDTKADTDASYDRCAAEIIRRVASEGAEVMVATHNQASIEAAVALMGELGLPPSSGVYFGQLLGMADHLTFTLGAHGYGAYKYVPFGAVDEVLPYLVRRAQENSDMLGGVGQETAMMKAEIRRRLLGGK